MSPNSPIPVFIPNAAVMWKMMRACIAVKRPEDLWVNQEVDADGVLSPEEQALLGQIGKETEFTSLKAHI